LRVAAIGSNDNGNFLLYWESTDTGRNWSTPTTIATPGELLPHLRPLWQGDDLYWATLEGAEASLCRQSAGAVTCKPLGSAWVDSFDVDEGRVVASVWEAEAGWVLRELSF
jgi:hypothetical protein